MPITIQHDAGPIFAGIGGYLGGRGQARQRDIDRRRQDYWQQQQMAQEAAQQQQRLAMQAAQMRQSANERQMELAAQQQRAMMEQQLRRDLATQEGQRYLDVAKETTGREQNLWQARQKWEEEKFQQQQQLAQAKAGLQFVPELSAEQDQQDKLYEQEQWNNLVSWEMGNLTDDEYWKAQEEVTLKRDRLTSEAKKILRPQPKPTPVEMYFKDNPFAAKGPNGEPVDSQGNVMSFQADPKTGGYKRIATDRIETAALQLKAKAIEDERKAKEKAVADATKAEERKQAKAEAQKRAYDTQTKTYQAKVLSDTKKNTKILAAEKGELSPSAETEEEARRQAEEENDFLKPAPLADAGSSQLGQSPEAFAAWLSKQPMGTIYTDPDGKMRRKETP